MKRPVALLVVAWLWIFIGVLSIACGGYGVFLSITLHHILNELDVTNPMAERIPEIDYPLLATMYTAYIIAFVLFALGVFIIINGFFLLKLRSWARTSLEVLSWLGLIWYLFRFIIVIRNFASLKSMLLEIQELNTIIPFVIVIIGITFGLIWVATCIVSIILLRKKSVREAINNRSVKENSLPRRHEDTKTRRDNPLNPPLIRGN